MLLIVKTGCAPEEFRRRGDFEAWIAHHTGIPLSSWRVVNVRRGEKLPPPEAATAVIISGSPAMVSAREDWSEGTARWLRAAVEASTPVLGICFGHQLLAQAFGGVVGPNPRGGAFGTASFEPTPDGEADALISTLGKHFRAHVSHGEAVLELPPGARLLARSPHDRHAAFALGSRAWGVQFHPEFDAAISRDYVKHYAEKITKQGGDPDSLARAVAEAPRSNALLAHFVRWAQNAKGAHS